MKFHARLLHELLPPTPKLSPPRALQPLRPPSTSTIPDPPRSVSGTFVSLFKFFAKSAQNRPFVFNHLRTLHKKHGGYHPLATKSALYCRSLRLSSIGFRPLFTNHEPVPSSEGSLHFRHWSPVAGHRSLGLMSLFRYFVTSRRSAEKPSHPSLHPMAQRFRTIASCGCILGTSLKSGSALTNPATPGRQTHATHIS